MTELAEIVAFLDREMRISSIPDYPGAMNGLQLGNQSPVERVIAAVDASLPVIQAAAALGPALLIVHHGMFWQGAQPITGAYYKKLKTAMDAGLAIYSCHLPLDIHPEWGNNVQLGRAIGLHEMKPFLDHNGLLIGIRGKWNRSRKDLLEILGQVLGGHVHCCPAGPESPNQIGIITGGAGSEVSKVAAQGVDTFITGEGPHWSYPLAEELGMNVVYGGHYATETFGVKILTQVIAREFRLPWNFIDHPTGL
jgi:dinuclear metal center YbgI/SA1388 family protein